MVWSNQTFFINNNGVKVNKENYCRHLSKKLLRAIEKVVQPDDLIFAQDGAPSHRSHLVQDFLKTKLKRRFIRAEEWSLFSPDVNALNQFYRDFAKTKVYKGRSGKPFTLEAELKKKIKSVNFIPRMKAVEKRQRRCMKMLFG